MGLLESDHSNLDICLQLSILLLSKETEVASCNTIIGSNCDLRVRETNNFPLSISKCNDICCYKLYLQRVHITHWISILCTFNHQRISF